MQFESLSALEEDLDHLLKIGKWEATTCWEAPIFDDYNSESDDSAEPFMGGHPGLMVTLLTVHITKITVNSCIIKHSNRSPK
jgi:hypothetical protein